MPMVAIPSIELKLCVKCIHLIEKCFHNVIIIFSIFVHIVCQEDEIELRLPIASTVIV